MPSKQCMNDNIGLASLDIEKELLLDLRSIISKSKKVGVVSNIKEDIISVKLNDLNIKEDMLLDAATTYDFSSDGQKIGRLDFNNALQYYEGLDDTNNNIIIEALKVKLSWFDDNRKRPFDAFEFSTLRTEPFFYKIRVGVNCNSN